jgi:mersacidin/lichenicidin family type 2 lantibiotic
MKFDIVRAWKDDAYRQNLSNEQRSQLPENPAGELELSDADLASVYGGSGWYHHTHAVFHADPDNDPVVLRPHPVVLNNGPATLQGGAYNRQQVSYICSIICSYNCDLDILDILDLGI